MLGSAKAHCRNFLTAGAAFAPQQDLLWEQLTPVEHLNFYGRLKGLKVPTHLHTSLVLMSAGAAGIGCVLPASKGHHTEVVTVAPASSLSTPRPDPRPSSHLLCTMPIIPRPCRASRLNHQFVAGLRSVLWNSLFLTILTIRDSPTAHCLLTSGPLLDLHRASRSTRRWRRA